MAIITHPEPRYSLINSVEFHPHQNIFCVTHTQINKIRFYRINSEGRPTLFQTLKNPSGHLNAPQHAAFSPDGKKLAVANWASGTLNLYTEGPRGYQIDSVTPFPSPRLKPHGIAFSPCGTLLAIAFGASSAYERAIGIYKDRTLVDLFQDLPGIPKGITFSPDGTTLLVTFADNNNLVIYDVDFNALQTLPHLSRPEDVKISPDGRLCAISNSDQNTVTFYPFDPQSNRIMQNTPIYTLEGLCTPHGLAFSSDGQYFAVTEFGPVRILESGDIMWDPQFRAEEAKVRLYRLPIGF